MENSKNTTTVIYIGLGQKVPEGTLIEFKSSYDSKFYVTTDLRLVGRGVVQVGDGSNHKRGKLTYIVTAKVMDKLKRDYSCVYVASL